jgi:hypothetical protein
MKNTSLILLSFLFSLSGFAAPCPSFEGLWTADESLEGFKPIYFPIRLLNGPGDYFQIQNILYTETHYRFAEFYEIDGEEHPGDSRYTGETYKVTCSNEHLTIQRNFKEASNPLISDYSYEGHHLVLKETFGAGERIYKFIKK